MATATIGRMQEFNPDNETITAYLERFDLFDLFVSVNGIAEEKRASTLLLVLGLRHYSLIRGLVSPTKPEDKTLAELTDILKKHYDPEPIVIAERFRFYQRTQKSGESVADFLASLRKLASRCKFGDFLSEALRDRLVCGFSSEAIQKSLLAKENLTLDTAMETVLGMEAAAKRTKELKGNQRPTPVFRVEKTSPPTKTCGRCGRGITAVVTVSSRMRHATSAERLGTLHLCVGRSLTSLPEVALSKQSGLQHQSKTALRTTGRSHCL